MLNFLKALVYGLVEGITEWLPISSTGHLILLEKFLKFDSVSEGFFDVFDVVIQLGAILAVVVLFIDRLWPFAFTDKRRKSKGIEGVLIKDCWMMWFKIIIACLPAAVIGILFDDVFNDLFYNPPSVAVALIVFGILFIVVENICKNRGFKINSIAEITFSTALQIGIFQILAAIFPGTSRSGATILGALLIGVSRTAAAEFTFFLAVPVMAGASLLKLVKFGFAFSGTELGILAVGCAVSFAVSLVVLRFLLAYIKKHDFKPFGIYRIILGFVVIAFFFVK